MVLLLIQSSRSWFFMGHRMHNSRIARVGSIISQLSFIFRSYRIFSISSLPTSAFWCHSILGHGHGRFTKPGGTSSKRCTPAQAWEQWCKNAWWHGALHLARQEWINSTRGYIRIPTASWEILLLKNVFPVKMSCQQNHYAQPKIKDNSSKHPATAARTAAVPLAPSGAWTELGTFGM